MADKDDLDASVREGIITAEQATAIRAKRAPGQGEPFKLVSNFGDVFLCIGLLFVYWSQSAFLLIPGLDIVWVHGGFAVLFWLLAEFFVFGARRKFPAVVSIALFVLSVHKIASLYLGSVTWAGLFLGFGSTEHLIVVTIALLAALIRFRQPVIVLGLGLCATFLAFSFARMHLPEAPARLVLAACGAGFLILGVLLDLRDRARTGIYHEWALWLFVLGSPLTVHPLFIGLIGSEISLSNVNSFQDIARIDMDGVIWTVAALACGFALIGLLLDRRSLVASTLIYLSVVLTYASIRSELGFGTASAIVPLTIGILVILLGVGWDHARAALLKITPFRSAFRPPDL